MSAKTLSGWMDLEQTHRLISNKIVIEAHTERKVGNEKERKFTFAINCCSRKLSQKENDSISDYRLPATVDS